MGSYSNLPEEIIIDILSRLPAKSVGRCRCVSKPWRALLSRPKFIRAHLDRVRNLGQESLIFISESQHALFSVSLGDAHQVFDEITISATRLSFADHPDSWTQVYCSCDGLVLVGDNEGQKFVLNPVTREIRGVPPSPFALDPSACFTMYGLGYDSASDDYKIVTLSYYDTDNEHGYDPTTDDYSTEMFVNVYSFKTDSWKRVESSPYDHAVGHVTSGVFVNGCIHWLASRTTDYKSAIVAFDLLEEKFREVPPPSSVDSDKFVFNYLALLGGCLCMFNENQTYVWMMKEYGVQESWTKFTIDDLHATEIKLLCLLGQEKLVLLKDDEQLVMYNFKEGTWKDVAVHGASEDLHVEASFVESLISPHGDNETRKE